MLVFLSLQVGEEGKVGEVEEVGEEKEVMKSKLSQGPIHLAHTQQFPTMDQKWMYKDPSGVWTKSSQDIIIESGNLLGIN